MSASGRNNVRLLGSGDRTIMFAHGFGCDQSMWHRVYPEFLDSFQVVLFDYVGAGSSDSGAFDRRRYSTLQGYGEDVLEIAEELGLKDINFVGHSVSSMIGALASITRPDLFESLVMVSPSPCFINDGDYRGGFELTDIQELLELLESNQVAWASTLAPLLMGNPQTPELTGELQGSFCRLDPSIAHHFASVTFLSDNRQDLPNVQTRTLLLQSRHDSVSSVAVGEFVHTQLPDSELVILEAEGHCSHMSAPALVTCELKKFLSDGERPSTRPSH